MKLPKMLSWDLAQTQWAQMLNPLVSNPTLKNIVLKNVKLVTGTNNISHRLGRDLQGWNPTRVRGPATIYDIQDTNPTPELTLLLVSDADVMVDLAVF